MKRMELYRTIFWLIRSRRGPRNLFGLVGRGSPCHERQDRGIRPEVGDATIFDELIPP